MNLRRRIDFFSLGWRPAGFGGLDELLSGRTAGHVNIAERERIGLGEIVSLRAGGRFPSGADKRDLKAAVAEIIAAIGADTAR
jgi:hypothetical protein